MYFSSLVIPWLIVFCCLGRSESLLTPSSSPKNAYTAHSCPVGKQERHATLKSFSSSSVNSAVADVKRNKFHQYEGPIVIIGFSSSTGNELARLADHLHKKEHGGNDSAVVIVHELGSDRVNDLITSCTQQVLDTSTKLLVVDYSRGDAKLLDALVKACYIDAQLLCVFVNVRSDDKDSYQDDRIRIENDIVVPNTDYELCIKGEGASSANSESDFDDWEHILWEADRLIARAKLAPAVPGDTLQSENTAHLTMGQHSFFLSLSNNRIEDVIPYVPELCADVDAFEIRTDLLSYRDDRFDVIYGMQKLRQACRPHAQRSPALPAAGTVLDDVMPFVYTVRTQNQAGKYPDDNESIRKMFQMLKWGLRAGVEILDVECDWDKLETDELLTYAESRFSSQVLGSHHIVGKTIDLERAVQWFTQCSLDGRAHGAKLVLSIDAEEDDRMAYEAGLIATELARQDERPVIPHVALILGDVGQFSRIINLPFTPVTHECLPAKAAPGQLSAAEIMTTRLLTNIFEKKSFAILGHNISYSVSPQMHGAAFSATKLSHKYVRADVATVEEFINSDFYKSDDFGGTSVTIPHKQAIIPYVDILSDAAKAIGSVNTLIIEQQYIDDSFQRVVFGDNTDWRGIYNPLDRRLPPVAERSRDYALILGAGGTARAAAYVAGKLGLKLAIYNRTPSKAQNVASEFNGTVYSSIESSTDGDSLQTILERSDASVRVIISTLPASANYVLPQWLLDTDVKPIIFDVNYKPYTTSLLAQAEENGCQVVRGSEMLWEQGVGQFELWTKRSAPYKVMKNVVLENCIDS